MRILTERGETLLIDERRILNDLRVALVKFNAEETDQQTLSDSILQLDDLFLLVVVGEFNAGKSAFINALLGERLLIEGVTPTTTQINLLRYGKEQGQVTISDQQNIITLPVDWLSEISIVDTPGTNAIIRSHELITSKFVPRSDLVLFLTSADRPFTESERRFLEHIRDWGKKVVIVINKIDIFEKPSDLEQVIQFVEQNAQAMLGLKPEVFPISARLALRAKTGEADLWEPSRFEPLETYIRETLDEKSRLQLKLHNPLGVARRLTEQYLGIAAARLDILRSDTDMLSDVESQLQTYQGDMHRDFSFRMSDIEKILFEMEERGQEFFDHTFTLLRVRDLFNKETIRREFDRQVIADTSQQIDQKVNELIDWLVDSDLRQWQAVNNHLADRRKAHQSRIVGDLGAGNFVYDRERLMDAVARKSQRVVDSYDRATEAKNIAQSAQDAVAASAILEVGAVGVGAAIAALASTLAMDVTGILVATFIAALGLVIIPTKRRAAKADLREKIADLRQRLISTLRTQFEKEIDRSIENINTAITPYSRFVRTEQKSLLETRQGLESIQSGISRLKTEIEEL